jgi:hypothetical protein
MLAGRNRCTPVNDMLKVMQETLQPAHVRGWLRESQVQ